MYETTPIILLSVPWIYLILSFLIAAGAIKFLAPLSRGTGWIDQPSSRKSHEGAVPLIGGWGLLIALLVVQAFAPDALQAPSGFWIGALLLFFTSLVDDRRPIRARYRLMVQMTVAVSGVSLGGQMLPSLGNLLGMGEVVSPWLVVPVSIIGTMALINAVNFSDGADGLCGGVSLIALGWLAFAVSIAAGAASGSGSEPLDYAPALLPVALTLVGALAGFLCFNLRAPWRKKASVFMGDSGSTLVGFTLAWIAIHATSAFGSASVSPVACLWIVAMPLADAASCFVRRLLAGVTPMTADLRHFHHLLGAHGLPVAQSVPAIHGMSFLCGLIGVGGWALGVPEHQMFAAFVLGLCGFIASTNLAWRRLDRISPARPQGLSAATPTSGSAQLDSRDGAGA